MTRGPRGTSRTSAACALLALATTASSALGQAAPASRSPLDEERRTALYNEGFDAASAGRWAEARERFAAALAIRASPKVLYSLAQAEEQLGRLGAASRDYARALDGARAAGESDAAAASENALSALAARAPKVRVVVSGVASPSSATATLDGEPMAVGTLVAVDPGPHRIVVSAPGMRDAQATVAISERQHLDVPVSMEPAVVPSAPAGTPVA